MTPATQFVATLEGDRHRKQGNAVKEVGGAVERIDDPAVLAVGPGNLTALFHQEGIGRAGLVQLSRVQSPLPAGRPC